MKNFVIARLFYEMASHNVKVREIVTPERMIRVRRVYPKPGRLRWSALTDEQIRAMPIPASLANRLQPSERKPRLS